MRWLFRSVAFPLVATILLVISATGRTYAQTDLDNSGVSDEPVLVVSVASLDGLLRDVNHITAVAGMPQAGAMLNIYVGAFSQGIDRSQPLGVVVRMVDGAPAPMVFVAISDVKAMLKRLEPQFGPFDELDDGTLVIQVGQNLVYIRSMGDWAFLAKGRDALSELARGSTSIVASSALGS